MKKRLAFQDQRGIVQLHRRIGYIGGNSLSIIQKDITGIERLVILTIIFLIVIWLFVRYFRASGERK